jgi:hypothetical protein
VRKIDPERSNRDMEDAESAMRDARRSLDAAEADQAEGAQARAENSLRKAEQELSEEERRYRNLRQYELLFKLKEELKSFRRQAQANLEGLQQLDAIVRREGRVDRHTRKAYLEPLQGRVKRLHDDVKEKAEAIAQENAIVYTYILNGCVSDLDEVSGQLGLKEVGVVPQELLGDIVRRLDMAIRGLEQDLQERREDQQQQGSGSGGQPQPRLVPPDAEIRMVMVLQRALNEEREGFFAARPDLGERKPTESESARLQRLYHQQGSLAELFDSLRQTFTGHDGQEPGFPGEEEGPR